MLCILLLFFFALRLIFHLISVSVFVVGDNIHLFARGEGVRAKDRAQQRGARAKYSAVRAKETISWKKPHCNEARVSVVRKGEQLSQY